MLSQEIQTMGERAKLAAQELSRAGMEVKNQLLARISALLESEAEALSEANALDLQAAVQRGLSGAKVDRLRLSEKVVGELRSGLAQVQQLPDPVGEVTRMWTRPNGLRVGRMRLPLGVIGIIYESRPNVTIEATSLCVKAGNAVILRGGSEAIHSNRFLADLFQRALEEVGLPRYAVQLVQTTDRSAVSELLKLEDCIDVMIPRGGEALIRFVTENAQMPVLKHYKGTCHVYVDAEANLQMAEDIAFNAKVQRPGVCNAMETLLVHAEVADLFLPAMAARFRSAGVELRGCPRTRALVDFALPAQEDDWHAEYLDLILAVKVVDTMTDAIAHIASYGSEHTEVIVTENYARAHRFVHEVQSSLVAVNASTRFNDGQQLGLGAEIGISTSRLHAFGPMGLEELTTTKFFAFGNGQIRE